MAIPLHGKHAYIRIKLADKHLNQPRVTEALRAGTIEDRSKDYLVISFATNFTFNLTFQNTSRAIVLGTDGILDVKTQGLLASSVVSMILTDDQIAILTALGSASGSPHGGERSSQFTSVVANAAGGSFFDGTLELDLQIIPVDIFKNFTDGGDLLGSGETAARGYVFEMKDAAIASFTTRGVAGDYIMSELSLETGEFIVSNITDT